MMKSTLLSTVTVSIGYTLLGWDYTTVSEANLYMKREFKLENEPSIEGKIVAVPVFGAIMITLFSGSLSDWLGRRALLILSSLLFFSGGLLMLWSPNIYILLLARLIVGSGTGLAFNLVPIYISEIAPPDIRGSLGTVPQFMFFVGTFFSYCLIFWMTLMSSPNWRVMIGAIFIPSIIYFALVVFYLPESPRWLVSDGKINEARMALHWLRGNDDVSGEIALIADGMNIALDTPIGEYVLGTAPGQSVPGTSTSRTSHHSSFYWQLSDPLVDILRSIHENMSATGSVRSSLFPDFGSFTFAEHGLMNEQRDDDNAHWSGEAYDAEEGSIVEDGLHTPLLSHAASMEVNGISASIASYGSTSSTRRNSMPGPVQDFVASSSRDPDIEEHVHETALAREPALHNVENTGRHPFRRHMVRPSETARRGPKLRVLERGVRHALFYGMLIQIIQQFTGITDLLRYTPQVIEREGIVSLFSDIGLGSHSTSVLISALIALLMLPCIAVAMMLMDVCGRRGLLLVTTPLLILSLVTMSVSNIVKMGTLAHAILFLFSLLICFCSYLIGLGPIPNILCSEMFPTRVRATCASICSLSFWFGGLLSTYCFPVMLSTIGLGGACGIYAFVCCIVLFFVYFRVPETKGLPLEAIVEFFKFSRREHA